MMQIHPEKVEAKKHGTENELIVYWPISQDFFRLPDAVPPQILWSRHRPYLLRGSPGRSRPESKRRGEVRHPDGRRGDAPALHHFDAKESGHLRDYRSPELNAYDAMFKDKEGMWSAIAVEPTNFIYNRQFLDQKLVPNKLMDLTNPGLKGLVSMQSTQDWSDGMYSFFYFATLLGLIGEKKWDEFVKAFLKNTKPGGVRVLPQHAKVRLKGRLRDRVASPADQGRLGGRDPQPFRRPQDG